MSTPTLYILPGSEIATDWSPMRPKIRCWRPEFYNWSPAGDSPFLSPRYLKFQGKRAFFKRKLKAPVVNCSKTKRRFYDRHIYLAQYFFSGFSAYRGRKRDVANRGEIESVGGMTCAYSLIPYLNTCKFQF